MANKNPIAGWLYQNKNNFNVQFRQLNWTRDYAINFYDYEVSCSYKGKRLIGRGIDSVQNVALEKASSELLERMICVDKNIDSIGLAASAVIDAKEHAKFEAMERYYLKEHLEKKLSFLPLAATSRFSDEIERKFNCKVSFFKMRTERDVFGIVARILSSNGDFSYGFSLGHQCDGTLDKSLQEALPNFVWKRQSSSIVDDCPWQITNYFHNEIAPLLAVNSSNEKMEILKANLTEHKIEHKDLFCAGVPNLKIYRFI